jgi:hypothetical protein
MEIKYKLWLEKDGHVIFGPGRFELFEAIGEETEDVLPGRLGPTQGLGGKAGHSPG